jgi:sugar phosphate isomerase/epimerase
MENRRVTRPWYVSTACVPGRYARLEDQLADYRAHGLHRIEVGWCAPPSSPVLDALRAGDDDEAVLIHNYFPPPPAPFVLNLASQDDEVRARSLAMAEQALVTTAAVGAPFYSVHAGFAAEFTPEALGGQLDRDRAAPRDKALETFGESIRTLCATAASLDVGLLIEPNVVESRNLVDGENRLLLLAEAAEIDEFMRTIDHTALGLLVDTGHLNVSAHTFGFVREEFVEALGGYIRAFHVHDNDGRVDQHHPVSSDSWVWGVLEQPAFAPLPAVIEARFESAASLQAHHATLQQRDKAA